MDDNRTPRARIGEVLNAVRDQDRETSDSRIVRLESELANACDALRSGREYVEALRGILSELELTRGRERNRDRLVEDLEGWIRRSRELAPGGDRGQPRRRVDAGSGRAN